MARATKDGGFELTTTMERVLRQVADEPGLWVHEIARSLNMAFPTVRDSLNELRKLGHVEANESEKEHHYYARTAESVAKVVPLLIADEPWAFLRHVALRPGMDWSDEIAEKTRLDPRTVKGHAQRFEEAGVVAKVPIARPTGGKPGIGYEVRWRNIDVLIGLALAHLPPKSRASARFAALLGMMP